MFLQITLLFVASLAKTLHKVSHQFSCGLHPCKIVRTVKILLTMQTKISYGNFVKNVMFLFQLLLFVAASIKNYIRFLINFPADFVLVKL